MKHWNLLKFKVEKLSAYVLGNCWNTELRVAMKLILNEVNFIYINKEMNQLKKIA